LINKEVQHPVWFREMIEISFIHWVLQFKPEYISQLCRFYSQERTILRLLQTLRIECPCNSVYVHAQCVLTCTMYVWSMRNNLELKDEVLALFAVAGLSSFASFSPVEIFEKLSIFKSLIFDLMKTVGSNLFGGIWIQKNIQVR